MKKYLEISEELSEEELLEGQPQFLRIEVASDEEAIQKANEYKSLFVGNFTYQIHTCNHSSEGNLPCEVTEINVGE